MEQGTDHREPLLPSTRQLTSHSIKVRPDARQFDQLFLAIPGFFLRKTIDTGVEVHVFAGSEVLVERELLGHVANLPTNCLRFLADILAQHHGVPLGKRDQSAECSNQGGLSRSIRAQQPKHFALANNEIHIIDSDEAAKLDRPASEVNDFFDARLPLLFPFPSRGEG